MVGPSAHIQVKGTKDVVHVDRQGESAAQDALLQAEEGCGSDCPPEEMAPDLQNCFRKRVFVKMDRRLAGDKPDEAERECQYQISKEQLASKPKVQALRALITWIAP